VPPLVLRSSSNDRHAGYVIATKKAPLAVRPELVEGLTTNGLVRDAVSAVPFSSFVVPMAIGIVILSGAKNRRGIEQGLPPLLENATDWAPAPHDEPRASFAVL
jgi:hypothetical protein